MTPCEKFDEKLLDYLYEELPKEEHEELRAHVESCARCTREIESYGRVRSAAKAMALAEAPAATSAKLMYQAAQLAPRKGKVIPLFRRVVQHPAYAMAAAFVVVGGVAGWQLFINKAPTSVQSPIAMEAAERELAAKDVAPKDPPKKGEIAAGQLEGGKFVNDFKGKEPPPAPPATVPVVSTSPVGATVALDGKSGEGWVQKNGRKDAPVQLKMDKSSNERSLGDDILAAPQQRDTQAVKKESPGPVRRGESRSLAPQGDLDGLEDSSLNVRTGAGPKGGYSNGAGPPAGNAPVAEKAKAKPEPQAAQHGRAADRNNNDPMGAPAAAPAAAPPSRPLGGEQNQQLAKSTLPDPPAKAPQMTAPTTTPRGKKSSAAYDESDKAEGKVLRQMNDEANKQQLNSLGTSPGTKTNSAKIVTGKPSVTPSAPAAAASPAPTEQSQRVSDPSADYQRALHTFEQQSGKDNCIDAVKSYRTLLEHFPEQVTGPQKLKYIKCLRRLGQYDQAKRQAEQLKSVTGMRQAVEQELREIEQASAPPASPMAETAEPAPLKPARQKQKKAEKPSAVDMQNAYH